MIIVETITTIIVFGLVFGIWLVNLHLDALTEIIKKFLYVAIAALIVFLIVGIFQKWF